MADPAVPNLTRVQAILHARSGLPEDDIVNTFHFQRGATETVAEVASDLSDLVFSFYDTLVVGNAVRNWLDGDQLSAARLLTLKLYDMEVPAPRAPLIIPRTLSTFNTTGAIMPAEVALCISYHGDPPITPRRRGRIYIGPLRAGTLGSGGRVKPHTDLITTLTGAADRLMTNAATNLTPWVVYSRSDPGTTLITGGYVDDAFDTVRRRGQAPAARTVWS